MACPVCGAPPEVGALCRECARQVPPAEGLIRDHVRSTVAKAGAVAWLIDGFGITHAVAERTTIGRSLDGQVVVLATSVSREHAELRRTEAGWVLRDLGSRNGSTVDSLRAQGRVALKPPVVIKVGDVALWLVTEVATALPGMLSMRTGSLELGLLRFRMQCGELELCVVGGGDPTAGGALLSRAVGASEWAERALAPLEFHLLRALCARALAEAESPAAVRGCVATKQLARDLPFQSKYPSEENVRQVVRRLRTVLIELGADGLLAVVPGRGYYVTSPVTIGAT